MDLVRELAALIQTLCEESFGVEGKQALFVLADDWTAFFNPDNSKIGLAEPYFISSNHCVAFTFMYLLFGVAASRDRLRNLVEIHKPRLPLVLTSKYAPYIKNYNSLVVERSIRGYRWFALGLDQEPISSASLRCKIYFSERR
jgi:hypothetical protein